MLRLPRQEVHAHDPRALTRGRFAIPGRFAVPGRFALPVWVALAVGCATSETAREPAWGAPLRRVERPAAEPIRVALPRPWQEPAVTAPARPSDALDPGTVLGLGGGSDAVVATVGDVAIHKSDVFDRMLQNDRRAMQLQIDVLVLDTVIADLARRFAIDVTAAEIDASAQDEEKLLRTQHEIEWGTKLTFDEYLERQFGLRPDEYRRFLRADLARVRYRGLVIRYCSMLEDRVEVRFIVHDDPQVLADARAKVQAGAEFDKLAKELSLDRSKVEGGRLGPFGRAFQHPVARVAFELEPGEVSDVFAFDDRGTERHALVYVLRRLPKLDAPFPDVRTQVVDDLERAPITPFEQSAFVMQYCRPTSALDSATGDR